MSQTLADILVPDNDWIDINTESGLDVGAPMAIQVKGNSRIRIKEQALKPSLDDFDGVVLTKMSGDYAEAIAVSGSLRLWAIAFSEPCAINVQPL